MRKKYCVIIVMILIILITAYTTPILAENFYKLAKSGTGLEAENPEIAVHVQIQNNKNISEDLIRSKVELKLRKNDIKVIEDLYKNDYRLSVYVMTLNERNSTPYYIVISMMRDVSYYNNGKKYNRVVISWEKFALGYGDKDSIIKGVEDYTYIFINEFYKANDF